MQQHLDTAERFVAARYPEATTAIVAGSTARGERTATSDIDLLLIGETLFDGAKESEASTHEFEGEVFEVFAYTPKGFETWAERGVAQHRPVVVHMLVEGIPIRADDGFDALRRRWATVVATGPLLDTAEAALRRYMISDLVDDLRDAVDPLERRVVASTLFERIAELMLLSEGRWIGTGKWLPRRLRELDPARAERLTDPLLADDYAAFADRAEEELTRAGGRVQAGFVR
ncbi:MAG: nucleotidyltransferase domain-containing protein [Microbacterium sp.]|nr:nucleotidyltransferase domain-containing protein [Microbacterium sp.]